MTKIEWTDEVWNVVTGCTKVSAVCVNCYAERVAGRQIGSFSWNPSEGRYRKFSDVRCHPERLDKPLHWRKPRRIFVCSMGDLFHPDVPDEFIDLVFAGMVLSPQHTFQLLTKRPELMLKYLSGGNRHTPVIAAMNAIGGVDAVAIRWPLPNVHLGVSVEDQATADERIPLLLDTPAALRFVSIEPLLGPVDLWEYGPEVSFSWLHGFDGSDPKIPKLDWVICGSESGPKRRFCDPAWIRDLMRQCVSAGVPFFLKQMDVDGKLVKMPRIDGQEWRQLPGMRGMNNAN